MKTNSLLTVFALLLALTGASCGHYEYEEVNIGVYLDSKEQLADSSVCAVIFITNKVIAHVKINGDSIEDTGRTVEEPLKPVSIDYTIYDSNGHVEHASGTATSPAIDVPFGETTEIRIPFDPEKHPEQLVYPYFNATMAVFADKGQKEDNVLFDGTYRSTKLESGEGNCGWTYHYTAK
jgi:hypothetical protein